MKTRIVPFVWAAALLTACGGPPADPPSTTLEIDSMVPRDVRGIDSAPMEGLDLAGVDSFLVAKRTGIVAHYPCTSCHVHPIGDRPSSLRALHESTAKHGTTYGAQCQKCHTGTNPGAIPIRCADCHAREGEEGWAPSGRSHLTVQFTHPNESPEVCFTCHARENPGLFALHDGQRATMDQAYRLCAGCHYMQAEDWVGGAHGKRIAGWRGERVVLSCTGCHNPHSPRFPIREPISFPKIPRREASH
ncbi:MAG: hypothetical protein OEZ65_00600 [Gemmatimonadota bacterium]|nr:hypothetical protein [Gemmatimonadota bacterium]